MMGRYFAAAWLALCALSASDGAFAYKLVDSQLFDRPDALSLSNDEQYRRDGTVTSMATCLAVANDKNAFDLWRSPALEEARSEQEDALTDYLQGMQEHVRHEFGFSTLYVCAHVIGAWYVRPDIYLERVTDGRYRHGTIVIDLGMKRHRTFDKIEGFKPSDIAESSNRSAGYGLIDALPLVRILSTPTLLPRSFFGGIVIRNARIEGTMLFNNLQLAIPLAFVDVQFRGNDYNKGVFGQDKPIKDTALAIIFSEFNGSLLIARSHVCGSIRIVDSRFSESVTLQDVTQESLNCRPLADFEKLQAAPPFMRVDSSHFAQSLKLVRSAFGNAMIVGSSLNNLSATKSDFGQEARIVENDIDSIQINCSVMAEDTAISFNHIDKDLFIDGDAIRYYGQEDVDRSCHEWWHGEVESYEVSRLAVGRRTSIAIASNKIGGGLGISNFAPSTLDGSVRLASNRVGNGSEIMLPAPHADGRPWRGRFDLQGSTYEGTIAVGMDPHDKLLEIEEVGQDLSGSYCPEMNEHFQGSVIELRAAKLRTLHWNLPLTCDHRWLGYGLTYDLWLPGGVAKAGIKGASNAEEQDRMAFSSWRRTLGSYQSASLSGMSEYLAGKGSHVDSRTILLEAKRLNYAPSCRPDSGVIECIGAILHGSDQAKEEGGLVKPASASEMAPSGFPGEDPGLSEVEPSELTDRAYNAFMVGLLWPGGYGAKPERALYFLVLSALAFFFIYLGYSLVLRWRLGYAPALIALLPSDEAAWGFRENPQAVFHFWKGDLSEGEKDRDQEKANDPKFDDEDSRRAAAALVAAWPDEQDWARWGTDQRLTYVQETLLPLVETCQKAASDPDIVARLKKLRRKLDRFGSTQKLGFSMFDDGKKPTRFTHWRYSIDTMVPFIDLHAYSNYYPESTFMRFTSVVQHVIGWWLMTVFIASAAIL